MDLLNPKVQLDLSEERWKIYSRNPGYAAPICGGRARCRIR